MTIIQEEHAIHYNTHLLFLYTIGQKISIYIYIYEAFVIILTFVNNSLNIKFCGYFSIWEFKLHE
jgi:hypothetical protein